MLARSFPRNGRGFVLPFAAIALAATSVASPRPQFSPQEYGLGSAYPVDVAVGYNGRHAGVRSAFPSSGPSAPNANGVTFWDLTSATAPSGSTSNFSLPGEPVDVALVGFGFQPSDCIEMTNNQAVTIGSGFSAFASGSHDQTYIDLFTRNVTTGVWSHSATHTVGPTTTTVMPWEQAGHANDLAITRDGDFAIINDTNYIHRLEMATGTLLSINIGYNWGPFPGTPGLSDNLCTPNSAVDSIALTNETAVITTSRLEPAGVIVTWVYLVDIANWTILLEQRIAPTTIVAEAAFRPHDVAITPDQTLAVVVSNRMVSLFDLVNNTWLATDYSGWASREYQRQVDSVEVTNDRAVILSDDLVAGVRRWAIDVYAISATATTPLQTLQKYLDPAGQNEPNSLSHDLAITRDGKRALVRTSFDNIYITDLVTPPTQLALPSLPSPNNSNAHEYLNYTFIGNYTAFSSDSVVIVDDGDTQIAVTIGAAVPLFGTLTGYVDFIDLGAATPSVVWKAIAPTGAEGSLPLDLEATRDRAELVVRTSNPFVDPSLSSGNDVNFFSTSAPFTLQQGYGGTGFVMGLDSLAVGTSGGGTSSARKRIVSVSESSLTVPDGRVHLVDRP